ncbi:hypothetical protein HDU87_006642 [Geranomyces variabilis]|uniref:Uncharacterized protein n=1 Tax=Geranomyces variabilis TaxID=109894 RepID=A0AAD5TEW6_9FUNG|nr:hypothetical protein HDU87_006642 [Geranomyces variabilis]
MGPAPKQRISQDAKRATTIAASQKKMATFGYSKSTTTKIWGPDFCGKKTELETHTMNKSTGSIVAPGFEFDFKLKVSKKGGGGGGGISKNVLKSAAMKMLGN